MLGLAFQAAHLSLGAIRAGRDARSVVRFFGNMSTILSVTRSMSRRSTDRKMRIGTWLAEHRTAIPRGLARTIC
jgi:hypothetical protein